MESLSSGLSTTPPSAFRVHWEKVISAWRPLTCVAAAATLIYALQARVSGMDGPAWHRWGWQELSWPRFILGFSIAAIPFFSGQYLVAFRGWSPRLGLRLLALSLFLLQPIAVGLRADSFSLTVSSRLIENVGVTSYFTDAAAFWADPHRSLAQWLAEFPKVVASLTMHSSTKPPGPILFHMLLIKLFGAGAGASTVGALLIAGLASLGVFAVNGLIQAVSDGDEGSGFNGASVFALLPGVVIIHPMFDQILPLFTCGMLGLWAIALRNQKRSTAFLCGLMTAGALFFSYSLFTLGVFLVGYTLIWAIRERSRGPAPILSMIAFATLGVVLFYGLLWASFGYDPWGAFHGALAGQRRFESWIPKRPYPATIWWDLRDFFSVGVGWAVLLLALLGIGRSQFWPNRAVAALGLLQVISVGLTGLLRGETARVFIFMAPVVLISVDQELKHWRFAERMTAFLAMFAVTAAIGRNLSILGL